MCLSFVLEGIKRDEKLEINVVSGTTVLRMPHPMLEVWLCWLGYYSKHPKVLQKKIRK